MKNDIITFPQFLSVCFLSSLSAVMFISRTPSLYVLICSLSALSVNLFVFMIYKGHNKKILKTIAFVYLSFYCVSIVVKFSDYMNTALSYGPACLIIVVLLFFIFFCTVKGFEALARASAVISVFVVAGLIYMLVCAFTNINFNISFRLPDELNSSVVLLFPSALYVLCFDSIKSCNYKYYFLYSGLIAAIILFFMLISADVDSAYPIQRLPAVSKIGVFKGSDCILLAVLTISCIFSVSSTAVSFFKNSKHKYITNSVYIFVLLVISVIIAYFRLFSYTEKYIFIPFSILTLTIIIILSVIKRKFYV